MHSLKFKIICYY